MIEVYYHSFDKVIKSYVVIAKTTYSIGINTLYPLITRFDSQRKIQDKKFYKRLKRDILKGCIMPPLTIAFVTKKELKTTEEIKQYVNENIKDAYILDGLQRLNTLYSAHEDDRSNFNMNSDLFINVIISNSFDKLLYRMITLNNGQKPMTPRHQIEILTKEMFDFSKYEFDVQTEKDRSEKVKQGSFNYSDISKAYLAFFTNNVDNENTKIINEKMDEILVGRIMDSSAHNSDLEFTEILELIDKLCKDINIKKWLKINNNLIGFTVGVKKSYNFTKRIDLDDFSEHLEIFEAAFKSVNPSKVNLGKFRRSLSSKYFENIEQWFEFDEEEVLEEFIKFI